MREAAEGRVGAYREAHLRTHPPPAELDIGNLFGLAHNDRRVSFAQGGGRLRAILASNNHALCPRFRSNVARHAVRGKEPERPAVRLRERATGGIPANGGRKPDAARDLDGGHGHVQRSDLARRADIQPFNVTGTFGQDTSAICLQPPFHAGIFNGRLLGVRKEQVAQKPFARGVNPVGGGNGHQHARRRVEHGEILRTQTAALGPPERIEQALRRVGFRLRVVHHDIDNRPEAETVAARIQPRAFYAILLPKSLQGGLGVLETFAPFHPQSRLRHEGFSLGDRLWR